MPKKLALVILTLCLVLTAMVPLAHADYLWKVSTRVTAAPVDGCLLAPDRVSYRLDFQGEVEAVGIDPPDKIRVAYQVSDKSTKWTVASRAVNLRKSSGYYKQSRRFTVMAGHKYVMRMKSSFHVGGKSMKVSSKKTNRIPSASELAAQGYVYC